MRDSETLFQALLGRELTPPDESLMAACIHGRAIMVTGAGGSIGAELCRQLVSRQPRVLILFERSEFALYALENALRQCLAALKSGDAKSGDVSLPGEASLPGEGSLPGEASLQGEASVKIVPVLGSILNETLVEQTLRQHPVDIIFHAAAYKQVPMLERNVIAGIRNNIFGTLVLARAARKHKVGNFIFISTDKAVKPVNVMGATKRFAELLLQDMDGSDSDTRYSIVRFGNVLGSSGSVLPLFQEQIRHGGPVTVTHPEVSRYFMSVTEAAQLVIQAGALAKGGEVFVLDMQGPVRIADLARKLITHMGLEVCDTCTGNACLCKQGIRITFTGLRPGEKLSEELLFDMAVSKTAHPKISQGREQSHGWPRLATMLESLQVACTQMDKELARHTLMDATSHPASGIDGHPGRSVPVGNSVPVKNQPETGYRDKVAAVRP